MPQNSTKEDKNMKTYHSYGKENPQSTCNPISKLLINWARRYVVISKTKPWEQEMHYPLLDEDLVASVKPPMQKSFKTHKSLLSAALRVHSCELFFIYFFLVFDAFCHFSEAYFLTQIVYTIDLNPENIKQEADTLVAYFAGILAANLLHQLSENYYRFRAFHLNFKIKTAITAMITDKILKVSVTNSAKYSEGAVINLVQVDINNIHFFAEKLVSIVKFITKGTIGFLLVIYMVGWGSIAVLVLTVLVNIAYIFVYKKRMQYQRELLDFKDERVSFLKSVLKNMEYIKLSALENFYCFKVYEKRMKEIGKLRGLAYLRGLGFFIEWTTPGFAQVIIYVYYIWFGRDSFDFAKFLGFMKVYSIIKTSIFLVNLFMNQFLDTLISFRRLDDFLNAEEMDFEGFKVTKPRGTGEVAIEVENGNFRWGVAHEAEKIVEEDQVDRVVSGAENKPENRGEGALELPDTARNLLNNKKPKNGKTGQTGQDFKLEDINLRIKYGEKVFVIGKSGSGKSSLLYSILGEMVNLSKGRTKVTRNGTAIFVAQDLWTIGDTARNNIVLGGKEDPKLLKEVIRMAQMKEDLKSMSKGLDTVLGDTGHTVSGGQRARVALARCFYYE